MIAEYLPTEDYLSLRLCSRAMVPLFDTQAFWVTRFFISGDRGYLSDLLTETTQPIRDWRLMYRCSHPRIANNDTRSWIQKWQSHRFLRDVCTMTRGRNCPSRCTLSSPQALEWQSARIPKGNQRCDLKLVSPRSRELTEKEDWLTPQTVPFSRSIVGIFVSLLRDHGETFIAGLELVYPPDTPNIVLGYRDSGNQVRVDFRGKSLKGFELVLGRKGLHALLPLFGLNPTKEWIGRKDRFDDKSVRLSTDGEILALSGVFNVSRWLLSRVHILAC